MKKKILIFGGNGFLANTFNNLQQDNFDITRVYRDTPGQEFNFDFENTDIEPFTSKLTGIYNGVLFLQGVNPSIGIADTTAGHFTRMLNINLVTPTLLVKDLADRLSDDALVLFVSSVAKKKGSYDPAYASAKAGLIGLMHSLAKAYPRFRFNTISPGLIKDSPVYNGMTPDYRQKHFEQMHNSFIEVTDVVNIIVELINDKTINRTDIELDGGYK